LAKTLEATWQSIKWKKAWRTRQNEG